MKKLQWEPSNAHDTERTTTKGKETFRDDLVLADETMELLVNKKRNEKKATILYDTTHDPPGLGFIKR
jgi:hypothetical protein